MIAITFLSLGATYALWVFYLAVMSLKHAKEAGLLTRTAKTLGYPVLIVGWVLDFFVNALVMTVLLVELPRELTVSARLKRHNLYSVGWRRAIANWAKPLLDPFDPSGSHI